jgi:hypothetical protein
MPSLFLTFLVVDAPLLSRKFISRLTQISTVGPYSTAAKFNQRFGLWGEAWIDMQYLTRRTQCITGLSTSRFLSLAVMILARNHLFDDFPISWTVVAAQAIAFAVIVGSAHA